MRLTTATLNPDIQSRRHRQNQKQGREKEKTFGRSPVRGRETAHKRRPLVQPRNCHFELGRTVAKRASGMLEDSELPRIRQPSECNTRCMRVSIFWRVAGLI